LVVNLHLLERYAMRTQEARFVAAAVLGLLGPLGGAGSASAANFVDAQGRQWLPLTTLTNQSWAEIDSVCPSYSEGPGACTGSLAGVDLTGWTWASRPEVVGLIGQFMAAAGDSTSPSAIIGPHGYGTNAHTWAASITQAMGITAPALGNRTFGFTSGGPGFGGDAGNFAWVCHDGLCGLTSYAAAGETYGGKSTNYGGWFYQAAAVPEPSGIVLMLAGATLLATLRRRPTQRRA
jgi:hypothetical protein